MEGFYEEWAEYVTGILEEYGITDGLVRHWKKQKNTFTSKRQAGWLPPSLQSKTDHHIQWIRKLLDLLPEGYRLSIELGRFDPARMKDPEIHGELYQKGPQYDYENVRAYVLARDGMLCFDYYRLIKSFFTQKTCKYGLF